MGTSAYEKYLAEKADPESVYAKYLASRTDAPPEPKGPSTFDKIKAAGENLLESATFGLSGLAWDARRLGSNAPGGFTAARDARRERIEALPLWAQIGTGLAGAVASPVGPFLGAAKAGAGLLRTAGKGMVEGALQGGATALGENIGTSDGVALPVMAGVGGGALLGGVAAPVAAKIAGRGGPSKPVSQATRRLLDAEAIDATLPAKPPIPAGIGMPKPMAVDVIGPTARGEVKAAARYPAARALLQDAFEGRAKEMPTAVATGVKNAKATEARLMRERAAKAKEDYDTAIEVTKGQPVQTPTLDALLETPTGRAAWQEAAKSRPDLVLASGDEGRALPKVQKSTGESPRPEGFESFDASAVRTAQVPDAEAIHLMTRYLRNWSKGEKGQIFPEGVNAESAQNALGLLEKAKAELPEPFRIANDNYAAASSKIDALQMGLSPWKNNPNPMNRRANRLAVRKVFEDVRKMPADERALVREGKAYGLLSRFADSGLTPAKAVAALDNPASALSQEFRVAGNELAPRMRAWNDVLTRQNDLLSAGTPAAADAAAPDLFRDIAGGVSMNPSWWATLTGRRIASEGLGALSDKAKAEAAIELVKMAADDPAAIPKAIAALKKMDAAKGKWSSQASARAGRVGGLLGGF